VGVRIEAAPAVAAKAKLWTRATSPGSVGSLIEHRASIEGAYSSMPPDLSPPSVGIEAVSDLIDDLGQALD